jgi:hypothetical protein
MKQSDPLFELLCFGDTSEQARLKGGLELFFFGNAIMYIMISLSDELQPYNDRIAKSYMDECNTFFNGYDAKNSKALASQFKIRIEAYKVAWPNRDIDMLLSVSLNQAITKNHTAVDEFLLNQYLSKPSIIKDDRYKLIFKNHNDITYHLFHTLMVGNNAAFKSTIEKYKIVE